MPLFPVSLISKFFLEGKIKSLTVSLYISMYETLTKYLDIEDSLLFKELNILLIVG